MKHDKTTLTIEDRNTDKEAAERQSGAPSRKSRMAQVSRRSLFSNMPGLLAMLLVGLLTGFLIGRPGGAHIIVNEKVYRGAIYAAAADHKSASIHLKKLSKREKSNLNPDERKAIFHSHLLNDRYDWALDVYPDGAENLVSHLMKKGNLHMVKNIESTLPPIAFEKAAQQQQYRKLLELQHDVDMTETRQRKVIEALIMTGEPDAAVTYAKKQQLPDVKLDMEAHFNKYAKTETVTPEQQAEWQAHMEELEQ